MQGWPPSQLLSKILSLGLATKLMLDSWPKMIIDIPTGAQFETVGFEYLNLAWESVLESALAIQDAMEWDCRETVDIELKTQPVLRKALSLTLQGTEFVLKGRIAGFSPMLLLAGGPSDWPKRCDTADIHFADFKTVDAQDLDKIYDTVISPRLDPEFRELYRRLRKTRNSVTHTVDPRIHFSIHDIVVDLLRISKLLIAKEGAWFDIRRGFLSRLDWLQEDVIGVMSRESEWLLDNLKPAQCISLLGVNRRQRRYSCGYCLSNTRHWDIPCRHAFLHPNLPRAKTLFCFSCGETTEAAREPCNNEDCRGNVISLDERVCLTCGCGQ